MIKESPDTQYTAGRGRTAAYVAGFLLSLALTMTAYLLVARHVHTEHQAFSHTFLNISIIVLALTQLFVQLIFFLHLGQESKPRWNLLIFLFAATVVIILVGGSLWIMNNLNYNHPQPMTPAQTDQYIQHDEGIK